MEIKLNGRTPLAHTLAFLWFSNKLSVDLSTPTFILHNHISGLFTRLANLCDYKVTYILTSHSVVQAIRSHNYELIALSLERVLL